MKRTTLITAFFLILHGLVCTAASPQAVGFAATEWNFGPVREFAGSVSHSFRFTNKGRVPLVIESTRTTCGCLTPHYSKSPVLPGAQGEIRILFDPVNRPGAFSKKMSVKFSGIAEPVALTIRGTVVAEKRNSDDQYPVPAGAGLRITHEALNFGQVQQGSSHSYTIGYINGSDKEVTFGLRAEPSVGWLRISGGGKVRPGTSGEVSVTCAVGGDTLFGRRSCHLTVLADGKPAAGTVSVTMLATDDFSKLTPGRYPRLECDAAHFEFGTVRPGKTAGHPFTLTNTGNEPLLIRNVSASSGVSILPGTVRTLAPGAKTALRCRITPAAPGKFTGVVTLVTNDPSCAVQHLRLTAEIRK